MTPTMRGDRTSGGAASGACFNLATRPLLTQHDRTAAIEADAVERVLANIDTDYGDCVVEIVDIACSLSQAPAASFNRWRGRSMAGPFH